MYRHFGIRTDRYKLIRFYQAENYWELYDLEKDPKEMKNLSDDPQNAAIMDELKRELKLLVMEVKDQDALKILENVNAGR